MSEITITEACGKLRALVGDARREPVFLTRRDRAVAAIVDAEQLQSLMDDAEELADTRAIRKLPPEAKRRVQAVVEVLRDNPRPSAAKRLVARPE